MTSWVVPSFQMLFFIISSSWFWLFVAVAGVWPVQHDQAPNQSRAHLKIQKILRFRAWWWNLQVVSSTFHFKQCICYRFSPIQKKGRLGRESLCVFLLLENEQSSRELYYSIYVSSFRLNQVGSWRLKVHEKILKKIDDQTHWPHHSRLY